MVGVAEPSESAVVMVTPPGFSPSVWAPRLSNAARMSLDELLILTGARRGSALFVAGAHPDDETLGLGRLMSMWARTVGPVSVVIASAGEACLDHLGRRPAGLAVRRLAEWNLALDDLGVGDRSCLGISDGRVADEEDALAAALSDRLGHDHASGSVVIAAPWRHDPHPDHRACARAAVRVADERGLPSIEFPVWAAYWGDPGVILTGRSL